MAWISDVWDYIGTYTLRTEGDKCMNVDISPQSAFEDPNVEHELWGLEQ